MIESDEDESKKMENPPNDWELVGFIEVGVGCNRMGQFRSAKGSLGIDEFCN